MFIDRDMYRGVSSMKWNGELGALYGDNSGAVISRYLSLAREFDAAFGPGEGAFVSAPGRTELAGNHTDHQNGTVLCAAVTLDAAAVASGSGDRLVRILSRGFGEIRLTLDDLSPRPEERGTAHGLVRGVAARLQGEGFTVGGLNAVVDSQVPVGGGLSSSAAFEVLVGEMFSRLYNGNRIDPITLAMAGQAAEREYFGKPSGLMDQTASACGGITMIDFADPAAPKVERISFDFRRHGYVLCAVDVGTSHADLTDDYAAIPADMKAVAGELGAELLRYADPGRLADSAFRQELARRLSPRAVARAEHFFEENARVPRMADALRRGDMEEYIRLMNESGASSRDKLGNVVPALHPERTEMARALDRAEALLKGRGAWRIHGGGFAGSIQCLTPAEDFPAFAAKMDEYYGNGACFELHVRPCGAHALGYGV